MNHRPIQYPPPVATSQDVADLVAHLKGRDWMTAEQIGLALGWGDRKVRKVASETDEIISHPGSAGYKLEIASTEEEVSHFSAALFAQARKMIQRALRVKKRRKNRQLDGGLLPL